MEIKEVGLAKKADADALRKKLTPHFRKYTYDLLRKNCNSFSDVCLRTLFGQRLDQKYRQMEEVGKSIESYLGLLGQGGYMPNPQADTFAVEVVVAELRGFKAWPVTDTPNPQDVCLIVEGAIVEC